jgi:hypothetical protein
MISVPRQCRFERYDWTVYAFGTSVIYVEPSGC